MRKKILTKAKAEEDIYEQALYIAQDSLKAAERYAFTVEKTIASLAENPKLGTLYKSRAVRLKGLRKLLFRASKTSFSILNPPTPLKW